jgi:hypothetical protein
MLLSSRQSSIKRISISFICQGNHTSFIHPTIKKSNQSHYTLLLHYLNIEDDVEDSPVTATPTTAVIATQHILMLLPPLHILTPLP